MRKFKGSLITTIGAVALTLGAATAALAVNAGILRSAPETGVGNLETEATVPALTEDPNVRYVTVFVDDPAAPATTTAGDPAPPAATVTAPPIDDRGGVSDDDGQFGDDDSFDDEGFDDDSFEGDSGDDHGGDDRSDDEHEYEGADDDD